MIMMEELAKHAFVFYESLVFLTLRSCWYVVTVTVYSTNVWLNESNNKKERDWLVF